MPRTCDIAGCTNTVTGPVSEDDDLEDVCDECRAMIERMNQPPVEKKLEKVEAQVKDLTVRVEWLERVARHVR